MEKIVGTPGKPVTFSSIMRWDYLVREGEGTLENQGAAEFERHKDLVESVIERERECIENDVVFAVFAGKW